MSLNLGLGLGLNLDLDLMQHAFEPPTLAALFGRAAIAGRDGSLTILRNTPRVCPYSGQTKAATGASAVAATEANTCTAQLMLGGFALPMCGAFRQASSLFLNSSAPATQAVTVAVGSVTIYATGTGYTITSSAGTATGSGFGAVTPGTPQVLTITGAGTVTLTVSGSPVGASVQVVAGAYRTTPIATAGAIVTHDADILAWTPPAPLSSVSGELITIQAPYAWNAGAGIIHPAGYLARLWDINASADFAGRDSSDVAQKIDTATQAASLSALADVSGQIRMSSVYWDATMLRQYRGAVSASTDSTLAGPWNSRSTVYVGNRAAGDRPWDGFICLLYVPGGLTSAERAALALAVAGRSLAYAA